MKTVVAPKGWKPSPRKEGESFEDYMIRNHAHPSCEEQWVLHPDDRPKDTTDEIMESGYLFTADISEPLPPPEWYEEEVQKLMKKNSVSHEKATEQLEDLLKEIMHKEDCDREEAIDVYGSILTHEITKQWYVEEAMKERKITRAQAESEFESLPF